MNTTARPDVLIGMNYLISACYCVAATSLVYASVLGFQYLTRDRRMEGATTTVGLVLAGLWFGVSLFLVGCGWHHTQHAAHLRDLGCAHDLCSSSAYTAAFMQAVGAVVAIGMASLLINLLGQPKPPQNAA